MIERKQKGTVARRKEKVRGGGRKPREARTVISEAAESLGPSLLFFGALAGLFSFDACKVFLAGILPRDPAGAPAQTRPQQSAIIPIPLRSVFCRSSPTYTWLYLSLLLLFQLAPNAILSSSRGYVPLFVVQRCCDGGNGDDGGGSSSSSWWRRIPEL